jgi:HSP20 family protein
MLTKFDPFKPMNRLSPWTDLDDLVRGFGLRTLPREFENAPEIRMDVEEDEKFYKVRAEIRASRRTTSRSRSRATRSRSAQRSGVKSRWKETWKTIYSERYYGKAYRSFTLPFPVENAKAEAKFEKRHPDVDAAQEGNGHARKVIVS